VTMACTIDSSRRRRRASPSGPPGTRRSTSAPRAGAEPKPQEASPACEAAAKAERKKERTAPHPHAGARHGGPEGHAPGRRARASADPPRSCRGPLPW
jgi:hypothetical protein